MYTCPPPRMMGRGGDGGWEAADRVYDAGREERKGAGEISIGISVMKGDRELEKERRNK